VLLHLLCKSDLRSQDEAKAEYVKLVDELAGQEQHGQGPAQDTQSSTSSEYKHLAVSRESNVTKIVLNRPHKKNALTVDVSFTRSVFLGCIKPVCKQRFSSSNPCFYVYILYSKTTDHCD